MPYRPARAPARRQHTDRCRAQRCQNRRLHLLLPAARSVRLLAECGVRRDDVHDHPCRQDTT